MRERILSSRIGPSGALMRAIENAARRKEALVQGSAAGFYGDTGEEAVSEKSPSGDGFLAEVVRRWERSVSGAEGLGVRLVLARTAVVLSAEAPVVARMALPVKYFAGGPLGSGRQWMSWIHAEDEARALVFLMEDTAQRGAFNLSSPCPERNSVFMGKLCRALGRPCLLRTPAFVLKAVFGRMAEELILSSTRVSPERLLEAGFRFRFEKLEAALGEIFGRAGKVDED